MNETEQTEHGALNIALYQPEIPPNTGNVMRLAANVGAKLHLIEPLGFALDDRRLRRAGMDYRDRSTLHRYQDLEAFEQAFPQANWLALSTRGEQRYDQHQYQANDVLLFGAESRGLPQALLNALPAERKLVIPQVEGSRSLNLANAVSVVTYEAWRQRGFRDSR